MQKKSYFTLPREPSTRYASRARAKGRAAASRAAMRKAPEVLLKAARPIFHPAATTFADATAMITEAISYADGRLRVRGQGLGNTVCVRRGERGERRGVR